MSTMNYWADEKGLYNLSLIYDVRPLVNNSGTNSWVVIMPVPHINLTIYYLQTNKKQILIL